MDACASGLGAGMWLLLGMRWIVLWVRIETAYEIAKGVAAQ